MSVFDGAVFDSKVFDTGAVTPRQQVFWTWGGRRLSKEEKRRERERLGIIPKKVVRIAEKIAARPLRDESAWMDAFAAELERRNVVLKAHYEAFMRELIRNEVERREDALMAQRRQRDDEEALLLLH